MPAPSSATYSAAALVAAHTALRDVIDSGSGAGFVRIRSAADVLLAQVPLSDPCGSVNGTTGQLTLSIAGVDAGADATGTAAHFRIYASDGTTVHMQGTITATGGGGDMTLDNTSIASGQTVTITSFTISAGGA